MRTMLKTIALLGFVAIAATWLISPVNATVICDFENGSADYDDAIPQSTGKFRDINQAAYSELSNNGVANDYLILEKYIAGAPIVTAYDTTPSQPDDHSVFYTPVGATTTATVDMTFHTWNVVPQGGFSFFDPIASSMGGSEGFNLLFMDYISTNDKVRLRLINTPYSIYSGKEIVSATDLGVALDNPILRLSMSLLNNGTSATVTTRIDTLDALEGNVTGNLWDDTKVLPYGTNTMAGEVNMNPAINGIQISLMRYVNNSTQENDIYVDRLTVTTVPEPSTFALLASGLIGLLAYAWRKRK